MIATLIQMSLLIVCGLLWKSYAPVHISHLSHRRALTDLVFYILLPALVLDVIWRAPLDSSSIQISLLALCGIVTGLGFAWCLLAIVKVNKRQKGALLLAAAFPNATFLGLPVLQQVIGSDSRAIVLQYDFFACTPILLSLGMLLAHHYGDSKQQNHPLKELSKIPALWAVSLGMLLNVFSVPQIEQVHSFLSLLAAAVVPLMLIVLGMSIRWRSLRLRYLKLLIPIAAITLIVVPLAVYAMGHVIGINNDLSLIVVLVAAMPTMVFGIVICERYQLDGEIYAAAVTLTTIISLITLTTWFQFLSPL